MAFSVKASMPAIVPRGVDVAADVVEAVEQVLAVVEPVGGDAVGQLQVRVARARPG